MQRLNVIMQEQSRRKRKSGSGRLELCNCLSHQTFAIFNGVQAFADKQSMNESEKLRS